MALNDACFPGTATVFTRRGRYPSPTYALLIALSTTLSLLWHGRHEPRDWTFYADYTLATLWTSYEFYLALQAQVFVLVLLLNSVTLLTNHLSDRHWRYRTAHTLWHGWSSAKAMLVASLVSD